MQIWMNIVLAVQLLTAIAMIGLVLIQHGKGADMGASRRRPRLRGPAGPGDRDPHLAQRRAHVRA